MNSCRQLPLLGLVVFVTGCEESRAAAGTAGSAASVATRAPAAAPRGAAAASSAPGAPSASAEHASEVVTPPTAPAGDAPLQVKTDGGLVPAAEAKRILHVGDSMVPLVGNYLRPILRARGDTYSIESVTSSSTLDWGGDKRLLQEAMYKYDPEVVLISLGSNELFDPEPKRRAKAIEQIVADTRGRPCLWLGPPAWKKDLGFIDVLKQHLGHCRYLDSTSLNLPRMADGRHPDWTGGYRWASATWRALGGKSTVPTGNAKPE